MRMFSLTKINHPCIIYVTIYILLRVVGGLELISADIRQEAEYAFDRSPVYHRARINEDVLVAYNLPHLSLRGRR